MLELSVRLQELAKLIEASNKELEFLPEAEGTGFLALQPQKLVETVLKLREVAKPGSRCLDLGCANGGFMLMAAAAGFPSYGIEINPVLFEHAQSNYREALRLGLIDPDVPVMFVIGNMVPLRYKERYAKFIADHHDLAKSMPQGGEVDDPYEALPVSVATADVIYTWAWPTQSRFLFNFLAWEAKKDAILVLPAFERYTQGEHMNASMKEKNELFLHPLAKVGDTIIGKKER
jgi:SAM-dependent methyltransferase